MSNRGIGDNSINANPGNYVRISRDIEEHPIVGFGQPVRPADPKRGSYSRAEAWLYLVFKARWRSGEEKNRGRAIIIQRGELMAARAQLAVTWNWSEDAVRWFLNRLETELMIARKIPENHTQQQAKSHPVNTQQKPQRKTNQAAVISIRNYNVYQTALEIFNQMISPAESPVNTQQPRDSHPHLNKREINNTTTQNAPPVQPRYQDIQPRLEEAAGACLANKAAAPGLLMLTDLRRWIEGGCDVEADILPAIRKVAAKKRPGSVWHWSFFEPAILELRDRRLTPLAAPVPVMAMAGAAQEPHWRDKEITKSLKHVAGMAEAKRRIAEQKR